jgi:hypothetical protein
MDTTMTDEITHVFVAGTGRGLYAFKSVFALIQWAETCSYKFLYAYYEYIEDGKSQISPEITLIEYTIEDWLRQDHLVHLAFERDGYIDRWQVDLVEVLG